MFLMEVRCLEDLERFRTDLKYVFGYLQNTSNKENMREYIEANQAAFEHMPEDAYDFMSSMSHSRELKKLKEKYVNREGDMNMCKAIREMIEEGRQEGESHGKKLGLILACTFLYKKSEGKTEEEIAQECGCPIEDVRLFFTALV